MAGGGHGEGPAGRLAHRGGADAQAWGESANIDIVYFISVAEQESVEPKLFSGSGVKIVCLINIDCTKVRLEAARIKKNLPH